ncbi:MAG: glycosyltransferase [Pararhodobacter sp.]
MHHPHRNRIAVLVRFSYPAATGTRATLQGPEAARRLLYDPARLERRFALFQALTLPSLLAQTDSDFTTLFLIGADFPMPARRRLAAMVAPLADSRLVALPPLPHFAATRRAFDRALDNQLTHLTTVRLDDDDAMSNDLIARLRSAIGPVLALSGADAPAVISFQNGLYLEIAAQGNRLYRVIERTPLGIGLAMVAPLPRRDTIFSRNHRLLPQFFNTWSDATRPAFIRSVHRDNDSDPSATGQTVELSDNDLRAVLSAHFAVSLENLRALSP